MTFSYLPSRSQPRWKVQEAPKQHSWQHHSAPRDRNLGWRHTRQPGYCGGAAAANVLLHQSPAAPAALATGGPDLGGEAKNCSRRRADAETGEPRTLHLPRSCGTMAREPLFDLRFLILTKNSKLIFTPDLQILRRRRNRNKKKPGHLLKVPAAEKRAAHGDSPGRALVRLSG